MNIRTAVKTGLAQFLSSLEVDGAPAFQSILVRAPKAGELEQRPFASIRARVDRRDISPYEVEGSYDEATGTMLFETGVVEGSLLVYVGVADQQAGSGDGEEMYDAIEAVIEAACDPEQGEDGNGTFGIVQRVEEYGASFGYYFVGSEDPPIEESVRGLVQVVFVFKFEGPEVVRRPVDRVEETIFDIQEG